jgi:prolyl 4-hydroxylase
MRPDIRNNERVILDDPAFAEELYRRLGEAIPETISGWTRVGLNERFRCYRYRQGQWFAPHSDDAFRRTPDERSFLTVMVYLNEGFEGGCTRFLRLGAEATPKTGRALLFQHALLHEGAAVESGVKYALRTDAMYRRKPGT